MASLVRIQYVSDLHLELYKHVPDFSMFVTPCAKYLALAGDIGQPTCPSWIPFFSYVSRNWERIVYVPGNHEYYTSHKDTWEYKPAVPWKVLHQNIRASLAPFPNITMLDAANPSVYMDADNLAIVGSTLWSYVPKPLMGEVQRSMNDYNFSAYDTSNPIQPNDVNETWKEERAVLKEQIQFWTEKQANVVVVTHHMPSFTLVSPRYKGSSINYAFASGCDELMLPSVKAWIYGHTHNVDRTVIGTTQAVVNARGYPRETNTLEGFSNEACVEII